MSFANLFSKDAKVVDFVHMLREYAVNAYLRDSIVAQYDKDIKKAVSSIEAVKATGAGVAGTEEWLKNAEANLEALKAQKAQVLKETGSFEFNEVKGLKALKDAWKVASTNSEREHALKVFFEVHGLKGAYLDLVLDMGGKKNASMKTRALKGRRSDDRTFSQTLFFNILTDTVMDAGLIKKDIIPESLTAIYEEYEAQAKARREAKKAERAAAKKARKNNK